MPRGVSPLDEARLQGRLWTPDRLGAGLAAWYDFSDLSRATFSGANYATVANWRGVSNLTASGATGPELWQDIIRARRAANFFLLRMLWGGTNVTLSLPMVVTTLFRARSTTANNGRILGFVGSGQANDFGNAASAALMLRLGGANAIHTFQNGSSRASTSYTYDEQPTVFTVTLTASGAVQHWLNGAAGGSGTLGSPSIGASYFAICCRAANAQASDEVFEGWMGEAVAYCGDDALAQRERIEGSVAWRFGCQDRLAASHPHRNAPPLIGG